MSEMSPEPRTASKGGNVLTRKLGPLPTWVWVAIVAAIVLAWALIKGRTSGSSAAPADTANASQVPQFVNQTVVQSGPPAAPDEDEPGPPGPPGPQGPPGPIAKPPHPKVPPRRPVPRGGPPTREQPPHTKPKPLRPVFRPKRKRKGGHGHMMSPGG